MTTPSPTDAMRAIADLIAKWRHAAENLGLEGLASLSDCADELAAALSGVAVQPQAQAVQAVPDGWQLVPVEPTVEMTRAAAPWLKNIQLMRPTDRTNAINDACRAMLEAAPQPPAKQDDELVKCRWVETKPGLGRFVPVGEFDDPFDPAACAGGVAKVPLTDERIEGAWRECATGPNGNNLAGGTNLDGWTNAIRWAEAQHGIQATND